MTSIFGAMHIELFTCHRSSASDEVSITTDGSTDNLSQLSALDVHHQLSRVTKTMAEVRTTATAVTVRVEPAKAWAAGLLAGIGAGTRNIGVWATDTAQQFGALVAALMGPFVFSSYIFALWSLADNLGWTDTFVFHSGPLSNWLIWLGFAILLNVAASILRRHTRAEEAQ